MAGILTITQAVTALVIVLPIGFLGAWLRRVVMRAYRRSITGWMALAGGTFFGLAIAVLYWLGASHLSITTAIILTLLSGFMAFLTLGSLTLGRNVPTLYMGTLYCLLALPVIMGTVRVIFGLAWAGAHLNP